MFKLLGLLQTVPLEAVTQVSISNGFAVFALSWLCGEADASRKTNKPQTKPALCGFVSLPVLFLFLFSMGLSFVPEFILNVIWFYNESSVFHVSTKHLAYFLFELIWLKFSTEVSL